MMFHQSFSHNSRRSKGTNAKRIILLSVLLGVILWLSYQVKHSYDTKHDYYRITEAKDADGHSEHYLGRKFHPGLRDETWDGKTSMSKHDSDEDSQLQIEQVENVSQENEEGPHEGKKNNEETEYQQSEITALESNVDVQLNNGDRYMKENDDAQKLGEPSEEALENPGQIDSSGGAAFQANGSEDTNEKNEEVSEVVKEIVSDKQDEISEGAASHESTEVENSGIDVNFGISLGQITDEEKGRISGTHEMEATHLEEDASQEQSEMGKDTTESDGEKSELHGQEQSDDGAGHRQTDALSSEEESVPNFHGQNELIEVAGNLGTESVERSSDLPLFERHQESSSPSKEEPTRMEGVKSDGHSESEIAEGVTATNEGVPNNAETNSKALISSDDRENLIEMSINHENPIMEAREVHGDLSSLSHANIIGITESKKWENNLLMVTDNAASKIEELHSQDGGVLDPKTVENTSDGGDSGPNSIDRIIAEQVKPSNENSQAEQVNPANENSRAEKEVQNGGSDNSISPVVFSGETNAGQGKEEF